MPGPRLTLDDVRAAMDTLEKRGIADPGVHRLRAHLGRGSVTTINKYKHQIRQADAARRLPATQKPLPDPISELAARIWAELHDAIDAIDLEREQETAAALAAMQQTVDQARDETTQAAAEIEVLKQALGDKESERAALAEELTETEQTLHETRHALELREQTITHLAQDITTLRENLVTQGRRHAESEAALKQALNDVQNQHHSAEQEVAALRTELKDTLQQHRAEIQQQYQYFETQLRARDARIQALADTQQQLERDKLALHTDLEAQRETTGTLALTVEQRTAERDQARQARQVAEQHYQQATQHADAQREQFEQLVTALRKSIEALQTGRTRHKQGKKAPKND